MMLRASFTRRLTGRGRRELRAMAPAFGRAAQGPGPAGRLDHRLGGVGGVKRPASVHAH